MKKATDLIDQLLSRSIYQKANSSNSPSRTYPNQKPNQTQGTREPYEVDDFRQVQQHTGN